MMDDFINELCISGGTFFVFEHVRVLTIALILSISAGRRSFPVIHPFWYRNVFFGLDEINICLYLSLIHPLNKSFIVSSRFLSKLVLNELRLGQFTLLRLMDDRCDIVAPDPPDRNRSGCRRPPGGLASVGRSLRKFSCTNGIL